MYEIAKIVDQDLIDDFLYQYEHRLLQSKPGEVAQGYTNKMSSSHRVVTRLRAEPKMNPEFCSILEKHIGDGSRVNQLDFLLYEEGDFFLPHSDTLKTDPFRTWTTVTMLYQSEDLEGGSLNLYRDYDEEPAHRIWLKDGETVIFESHVIHEAAKVEKGTRIVMVAWLHKTT